MNENKQLVFVNITIQSGGTMTHTANTNARLYTIDLNVTNLDVQAGGSIDVSGRGFSAQNGPGRCCASGDHAGASYGGVGGSGAGWGGIPRHTYGSMTVPT